MLVNILERQIQSFTIELMVLHVSIKLIVLHVKISTCVSLKINFNDTVALLVINGKIIIYSSYVSDLSTFKWKHSTNAHVAKEISLYMYKFLHVFHLKYIFMIKSKG